MKQDGPQDCNNVYGCPVGEVNIPFGYWRKGSNLFREVAFDDLFVTEDGTVGLQDGGVDFSRRANPDPRRVIVERL
jgi:hypothetical protein